MTKATIGSVIWGTLRNEDLLSAFADELSRIADPSDSNAQQLINEARTLPADGDAVSDVISELMDALTEYAPAHCYFGTLEGDGSCFGFWPDYEWLNYNDGDTLRVDDLAAIPDDYDGEALVINDHGNISLYFVTNGQPQHIWSIV